jgi:hypothetical protein
VGWLATDEPLVATICVIASDVVATSMMLPKTWREPGSETLCTYVLASAGGAAAAASVGAFVPSLLLYPLYFCLVNGAVACLIARRRSELGRALAPGSALQCTRAVRSGTAVE